jgi:hypothetical protein
LFDESSVTALKPALEFFPPIQQRYITKSHPFRKLEKIEAGMDMSSMSSNMPGMTMTDSMPSSTASATDCSPTGGMDMSNDIDPRMDLLMTILDDTELQVIANFYAVRYWYGVIVIIGLAALLNVVVRLRSRSR